MKKLSLILLASIASVANAQVIDTCEVWFNDTIGYIDAKTSAYSGISINQVNDVGGVYGYAGYAQKFEAPDTVTVHGFCFYGVMDSGSSFSAAVKMYDGASGSPGAMIAGTTHVIPYFGSGYTGAMNDASILQCAVFSSPVEWEGDYFLGIENFSSSDMYVARNADGDGAAEGLSYTYYKGVSDPTYDGWYDMYAFGAGWDFDVIIRPIVSYHAQHIIGYDTTVCLGDTFSVANELIFDDSLLYNKFYNPNHASYTGFAGNHWFDYGDMTLVTTDTFHVYAGGGNMDVTYATNGMTGTWQATPIDLSCMVTTEVVDVYFDVANQNACSGDSIYFVADSGYDSYVWNDMSTNDSLLVETNGMSNGDYSYYIDYVLDGCASSDTMTLTIGDVVVDLGNDTTLCLNENILLSPGVYDSYNWSTGQTTDTIQMGPFVAAGQEEIIVEVTQGSCSGADTLMLTIDNCLGVEETLAEEVTVYPNPSNGQFYLNAEVTVQSVAILNLAGQVLAQIEVKNEGVIDFSNLPEGTYLIEVRTLKGIVYKKMQIIR